MCFYMAPEDGLSSQDSHFACVLPLPEPPEVEGVAEDSRCSKLLAFVGRSMLPEGLGKNSAMQEGESGTSKLQLMHGRG